MEDLPLFRAPKRRKPDRLTTPVHRGRESVSELDQYHRDSNSDSEHETTFKGFRTKRQAKPGKAGVTFTSSFQSRTGALDPTAAPLTASSQQQQPLDITGRFVGSTGQKIDVDQHMLAYVDSQIAKRRQQEVLQPLSPPAPPPSPPPPPPPAITPKAPPAAPSTSSDAPPPPPPAPPPPLNAPQAALSENPKPFIPSQTHPRHHQLSEVPIPPPEPTPPPQPKRQRIRKPRLDRHGRPLPPRRKGPRRRPSEDIARDALVDAVLSESRLEHYQSTGDVPISSDSKVGVGAGAGAVTAAAATASDGIGTTSAGTAKGKDLENQKAGAEEDHDEVFAAQFQQDFEDRMAERRRARKSGGPPGGTTHGGGGARRARGGGAGGAGGAGAGGTTGKTAARDKAKSHGPRLGGSRNARMKKAAERAAERGKGGKKPSA